MGSEKFDILVADDEQSMREFLEIVLSNEGYRVCCVSSGDEAIECLRTEGARVFLQDLRMGGLDGMELLEAARDLSVPMPATAAAHELFVEARSRGLERENFWAAIEVLEERAGVRLSPRPSKD